MLILLLFNLVIISSFCTTSERDTSYLPFESLSVTEAVKKSINDKKPIMLYFHAEWCGICHRMNQLVWPDQDLQNMMTAFRVLDMYDGEDGVYEQRIKYRINSFPSLVFLNPKGERIAQFGGMLPAENLVQVTNKILDEYPPKGNRPKVRSVEEKLPLDWFDRTLPEMQKASFDEDRPILLIYPSKDKELSEKFYHSIKTNINLRRLMKFFLIKDLSKNKVLEAEFKKQMKLKEKPGFIFLGDQLEQYGLLFFDENLEQLMLDMQALMTRIAQIFNDRLLRRIHEQVKKETHLRKFKPEYLAHYLIYEFKQFQKQDAILIFSKRHGLNWLTENDFLEGHRILDIQVENQKLILQANEHNAVIVSGLKNKSVSIESFVPVTSVIQSR